MRIAWMTLALLLAPAVASAKPLPQGMKITLVKKKLIVTQNGVSVQLGTATKLASAELSADGKTISIKTDEEEALQLPLVTVEAKLENALGMTLHNKKKFAEAAPHFAIAAQRDPTKPLYATNLLSAQSMGGKLEDADKTLATYGKRAAPWFAWRLVVDPELKAIANRPSAKLGPATPGRATSKLVDTIAYSPLGFAASEVFTNASMGDGSGGSDTELAIVDLVSGQEVLRLPAEHTCGESEGKACARKQAPITARQRKVADAILSQLGFDVVVDGYKDTADENTVVAKDGRKVVFDQGVKIIAGKLTKELVDLDKVYGVAFVPKAVVIISKDVIHADEDGGSVWQALLTAYPTP